jgi:beta-galactosidase
MLDGNTASGGWSNFYRKAATALLPTISAAHQQDWVSVSWPHAQTVGTATAYFTIDTARALPATIQLSYWDGRKFVPARDVRISWATASNQPTTITFDPVRTTGIRLVMTSRAPNTPTGFIQIAELQTAA